MTRDDLLQALQASNLQAFLRLIRQGESSQDESAYTMLFGGEHFDSFADHPRRHITRGTLTSTAAGAYQFLERTWDNLVRQYGFPDFSPASQDQACVALIAGRRALESVIAGRIDEAIRLCAREWASLPGSPYGQPTQTQAKALEVYRAYGGQVAEETQALTSEVKPVGAILALLPSLIPLIPQLGQLFGSGSEVQQRNVAAASIVADTVVKATGSPNFQAAIEKMQGDPEAVKVAQAAIADVWPTITESGGGGIKGARDAALNPDQIPFYRNPAFVISMAILPLIYMVAVAVLFGVGGQSWSDDIKTLFVTAIVSGALGSIQGFFLGSSLGSQKKDALIGK